MRYGNLQEDAEDGEGKGAVQEFVGAGTGGSSEQNQSRGCCDKSVYAEREEGC